MDTTMSQPASGPPEEGEAAVMSWLDHAKELRDRMLKASIATVLGLLVGFYAVTWNNYWLVAELIAHFNVKSVQTIRPAEGFTEVIKLALGVGVTLAMPVIIYQLLAFIVPALTNRERRIILFVLPFVMLCFISGLVFGWFITLPAAFNFLLGFGSTVFDARPTLENFISLFTRLMLINGILFELPIVVYSVIWLGAIQRSTLTRYRRYSILVIVIIAAVITPTGDPVNLSFTAVPMYLLYELGLLLALVAPRKRDPKPTV